MHIRRPQSPALDYYTRLCFAFSNESIEALILRNPLMLLSLLSLPQISFNLSNCTKSFFPMHTYYILISKPIRMAPQMEMAVGLDKGHKVTKLPKRQKPSQRKGHRSKRVKFIRDVIREVSLSNKMVKQNFGTVTTRHSWPPNDIFELSFLDFLVLAYDGNFFFYRQASRALILK